MEVVLARDQIRRDFLFVTDFINLLEMILKVFPNSHNSYNLGYGMDHSLKVAEKIAKLLGKKMTVYYHNTLISDIPDMRTYRIKVSNAFNRILTVNIDKGL